MHLPKLRLWEQSALRPEDSSPAAWVRGPAHRQAHTKVSPRQDLSHARADRLRKRAAAYRGMMFSVCLSIPVGGTYGLSTLLAQDVRPDQCQTLVGALGPKDQHRIRQYRASSQLSLVQERALNVRICDPTLIGMVPQLARMISNGEEFEDMAQRLEGVGEELNTMTVLRALFSTEEGLR